MNELMRTMGGIAWRELLMGWRSAGYRAALALCAGAAAVSCAENGTSASLAAYLVSREGAILIGLIGLVWMSNTACRDAWMGAEELVLAKPLEAEAILIGRFAGNFALVTGLGAAGLVAGAVMQVSWGGTPLILSAYGHALARMLTPLLTLSVLGFSFCTLFGTPVAGGVVALYWVLILAGASYVARIFDFSLAQNALVYLLLSAGVFALTLLAYQPRRRGERVRPHRLAVATALLLGGGLLLAVGFVRSRHDMPFHSLEGISAIASQHLEPSGRIPGFWLPGTPGPRTGLTAFDGRILVVGIWSPAVRESLPMLELLRDLHQEYDGRGVAVIAVCICEDTSVSGHFARENRYPFPMLYDPGARATEPPSVGSPVAEAYDATMLPKLVVAGRDRAIRYVGMPGEREDPLAVQAIESLLSVQK